MKDFALEFLLRSGFHLLDEGLCLGDLAAFGLSSA
jgi:hypothetical protein